MSSLDQAFIRAYSQEDSQVETMNATTQSPAATTSNSAGISQVVRLMEVVQRLECPTTAPTGRVPTPHLRNLTPQSVLSPQQSADSTPPSEDTTTETSATAPADVQSSVSEAPALEEERISAPHFDVEVCQEDDKAANSEPTEPVATDEVCDEDQPSTNEPETVNEQPAATDTEPQTQDAASAPTVGLEFLAQWEVDGFAWPTICGELIDHCQQEIADLIDAVLTESQQQPLVLSIGSCADGEGSSTLALCLAKLAAERGGVVALVDGDQEDPRLAHDLDLNFRCGWEALGDDMDGVEETAIVSLADGVTFLPLRKDDATQPSAGKLVRLVATLAQKFPLVIVDHGPDNIASHPWDEMSAAGIDLAAFIVRDARSTSDERLETVLDAVYNAGVQAVGVVENFATVTV